MQWLLLLLMLLMGSTTAFAGEFCVQSPSPFGIDENGDGINDYGIIDGADPATVNFIDSNNLTQVTIDGDCTFRNFPSAIYPSTLDFTLNFQTNDPSVYLITFDNVFFTGNMACANIDHRIWFVNGDPDGFRVACQDLFIPVEAISKQVPPDTTTVGIGEVFDYTLRIPVLYDPVTGTYINNAGSANDIHSIVVNDDLNEINADLTLAGTPTVQWATGSSQSGAVAHTFSNTAGSLEFVIQPTDPNTVQVQAGDQIEIQIPLSVDDTNAIGTQFFNTAQWTFGRVISLDPDGDGIFEDVFFNPLPGENGVSEVLTIGAPDLTLEKYSLDTTLAPTGVGTFTLDVQNIGNTNAWDVTITDVLPESGTASMCGTDPSALGPVTAGVYQADGTSLVRSLVSGVDYAVGFVGSPTCELSVTLDGPNAYIDPGQRLILTYQALLDPGSSVNGEVLSNIAGATRWYSADENSPFVRTEFTRTLSADPAVAAAVLDFEDSFDVTVGLAGYYFQKTVNNVTSGANPATIALAGDTLHYRLRVFNVNQNVNNILIIDQLDALSFDLASLSITNAAELAALGAVVNYDAATGLLSVDGGAGSLDVAQGSEVVIEFDIELLDTLIGGDLVSNQALLSSTSGNDVESDNPFVNGVDDPQDGIDEADPTEVVIVAPGGLSKSDGPATATIGETFTYTITLPQTPVAAPLYDVRILDTLGVDATGSSQVASVSYVSAVVDSGGTWTLSNTGTASAPVIEDTGAGIDIPANGQAVITITARLDNNVVNQAGLQFYNNASYTYNRANGNSATQTDGSGVTTTTATTVLEPAVVTFNKTADNTTPTLGQTVHYTVTMRAASGANRSDVLDVTLIDNLPLGLAYVPGSATVSVGLGVGSDNAVSSTDVTGDGISGPQTLIWGGNNADIDIQAGDTVTFEYDVQVTEAALGGQLLENRLAAQWTSLDGSSGFERSGSDGPGGVLNDYAIGPITEAVTTPELVSSITKIRSADTYDAGGDAVDDDEVRIGDLVEYTLTISVPEGTLGDLTLLDSLPAGLAFAEIVSINTDIDGSDGYSSPGAPFSYDTIAAASLPVEGQTGSLSWPLGNVSNPFADDTANDFVIVYRARVLDGVLAQTDATALTNSISMSYLDASGAVGGITDDATITLVQPILTVTKSIIAISGGNTSIDADEVITYSVDITNNSSTSPAYDVELVDVIPVGLRNGALTVTTVDTQLPVGNSVAGVVPSYDALTGVVSWDFDTGVADAYSIPTGQTLRLIYQVQADSNLGAGISMINAATATYYSYDDDEPPAPNPNAVTTAPEVYTSNTSTTSLTSSIPGALIKETPFELSGLADDQRVSIGDTFTYRITIPESPLTVSVFDVQIVDNLAASSADLSFVNVTAIGGPYVWTPENTGDATNLLIEDPTNGIDIAAGEQIQLDVTVRVDDTSNNVSGLVFSNVASWLYNQVPNDPSTQQSGPSDTSGDMIIVEPDQLTLEKTGPLEIRDGVAGDFRLNIHNDNSSGFASTAWDITVTDRIPQLTIGGMCDTPPDNFVAAVYQADGTTLVTTLTENVDYQASFDAANCILSFTMQSANAALPADYRLIIDYQAYLDPDTPPNQSLTNIAGTTEWFSNDTAGSGASGEIRTYTEVLTTDPAVATAALDHEDAHTVVSESPVLVFEKTVFNVTTGGSGANASPGDTLRYTIQLQNISPVDLPDFTLTDELDALNSIPLFVPGSLVVTNNGGGNDSATNASGGANGTGLVSIENLGLSVQGGANDSLTIEFQATLISVIDSGSVVLNQAQIDTVGVNELSDDPAIGGTVDPTQTLIASAPAFQLQKTSQDISGDPALLIAGDTLRYTITVKNIGDENAVGVTLQDSLPGNTTYVAGSTTLNGSSVTDGAGDSLPLIGGLLIYAPSNLTPGFMAADSAPDSDNVATITFDVVTDPTLPDGTVISNQGFISGQGAGSGDFPLQPSDDPDTPAIDDPTLDVVGNYPLVDVRKTVAIVVDSGTAGIVDAGDQLRYTITATNFGAAVATGVTLMDMVPADTSYVPNSVTLNGIAVPDSGGASPLEAGMPISSSDLTPPLPGSGNGELSIGASAVVTFDVLVDLSAPPGTIISNQGYVDSNELEAEPTDFDGIDANGDQPTTVVVGNIQYLSITKQVTAVSGIAEAGSELEYVVRVTNIGLTDATDILITDNLDLPVAGQVTYVAGSGLLNGLSNGVNYSAPLLSANYSATYGNLAPNQVIELRFRVVIDLSLPEGTIITNTGYVTWSLTPYTEFASVDIAVGGVPGTGTLYGEVWHDSNFDNLADANEDMLSDWTIQLYRDDVLVSSTISDTAGAYRFNGLYPNDMTSLGYELRFIAPGATATSATLGTASSSFTNWPQRISDIFVSPGGSLPNLDMPRQPNGVVYDAITRTAAAGVELTMINQTRGNLTVPQSCFDDPNHQGQVTGAEGYYKFDLNFSDPASCAEGDEYEIVVQPPASGFLGSSSLIIPPVNPVSGAAQDVTSCPGTASDQVPSTPQHCENSDLATPPPASIAPRTAGTEYYLKFIFDSNFATDQIFNNHIPVDPDVGIALALSKESAVNMVTRSDLVPYTITMNNTFGVPLFDVNIVDTMPPGFKYVRDSARLDGQAVEPEVNGRQLVWPDLFVNNDQTRVIQLLLVVGSGVGEGDYVNTVYAINSLTNDQLSRNATATVQLIPDPTFDCTDVIGKVFDDKNLNGYQDEGEQGLAGVQLATARGLRVTTDPHGRFHLTCAAIPNEIRGSNFILKLDDRSLPSGYRLTTENPRVQRATRGKMLKFNFGAVLHRIVRLDLADGVFEAGSTELRPQWVSRIDMLLDELQKAPSILRLTYLGDNESDSEIEDRLDRINDLVSDRWQQLDCCYELVIEKEVFWRKGKPSDRMEFE